MNRSIEMSNVVGRACTEYGGDSANWGFNRLSYQCELIPWLIDAIYNNDQEKLDMYDGAVKEGKMNDGAQYIAKWYLDRAETLINREKEEKAVLIRGTGCHNPNWDICRTNTSSIKIYDENGKGIGAVTSLDISSDVGDRDMRVTISTNQAPFSQDEKGQGLDKISTPKKEYIIRSIDILAREVDG